MQKRINLKTKLVFAFFLLSLIILLIGIILTHGSSEIAGNIDELSVTLPNSSYLKFLKDGTQQVFISEITLTIPGLPSGAYERAFFSASEGAVLIASNVAEFEKSRKSSEEDSAWIEFLPRLREWQSRSGKESYGTALESFKTMSESLGKLIDLNRSSSEESLKNAAYSKLTFGNIEIGLVIGGFVISSFFGFFFSVSISEALTVVVDKLSKGAWELASTSGRVSQGSQELAFSGNRQAESLEEISNSVEEMTSMIKRTAESSGEANSFSQGVRDCALNGKNSMEQLNLAMKQISVSGAETAKIIKTIEEIAFQTSLLALNAAVEAARAGEHGKGFAVVADEVRNLAKRAGEAAKNTGDLIQESTSRIQRGVGIAGDMAKVLNEINLGTQKVGGLLEEISIAAKEQSHGISQINESVSKLDQITQQTASNAEESAASAQELSFQSTSLKSIVEELALFVGSSRPMGPFSAEKKGVEKDLSPNGFRRPAANFPTPRGAIGMNKPKKPHQIIPFDDDEMKEV